MTVLGEFQPTLFIQSMKNFQSPLLLGTFYPLSAYLIFEKFHPPLLLGSPLLLILEDFPPYPLIMASPFIRDLRVFAILQNYDLFK